MALVARAMAIATSARATRRFGAVDRDKHAELAVRALPSNSPRTSAIASGPSKPMARAGDAFVEFLAARNSLFEPDDHQVVAFLGLLGDDLAGRRLVDDGRDVDGGIGLFLFLLPRLRLFGRFLDGLAGLFRLLFSFLLPDDLFSVAVVSCRRRRSPRIFLHHLLSRRSWPWPFGLSARVCCPSFSSSILEVSVICSTVVGMPRVPASRPATREANFAVRAVVDCKQTAARDLSTKPRVLHLLAFEPLLFLLAHR